MLAGRSLASVAVLALAAAACSGGEDVSGGPDDTGGTSGTAGTSVRTTVAAPTTAPATIPTTTVPTTAAPPATTTTPLAPATSAEPPATPAPAVATPSVTAEYALVAAPAFPARSDPPPPGEGWPDGTYYAVVDRATSDSGLRLDLTLYQVLTGPEALDAAAADGEGLDSDIYVRPAPAVARQIELTPAVALSVALPDRPGVSLAVSGPELVHLVSGGGPSALAPSTYRYLPFPYLVTVRGATPVSVEQLWSP